MNSVPKGIIPPENGRVCHYHPGAHDRNVLTVHDRQPMAASIAYVWSDRMINVTVSDHNGQSYGRTSVPLLQPGDPDPMPGTAHCTWMPYQLGQLAKTEAAEKALAEARAAKT